MRGVGRRGRRQGWGFRTFLGVLSAFAVSAALTAAVSATVGGDSGTYVGDGDPNFADGGADVDTMTGAGGDDYFRGRGEGDSLAGDAGDDTLIGDEPSDAGVDTLTGGDGNDEMSGGPGNDSLDGGAGSDLIGSIDFSSAGGPNSLEAGNDVLTGGIGEDIVLAGAGNDTVNGGFGLDSVDGGGGNDTLRSTEVSGAGDFIMAGDGIDRVEVRNGTLDTVNCGAGLDTVVADDSDVAAANCEAVLRPPPIIPRDTTAPDTSFDSGKSKLWIKKGKKKAKGTYTFSASEPNSTFKCKIDDGGFAGCTSPLTVKLKKGAHTIEVRATDAAGNVDSTPAIKNVKVKKRKGGGAR